ncbi:MAG: MarR family transcriptional regulator [Pseudomonadota bacterium]
MIETQEKERLAEAVGTLVRAFLVAGRAGQPAEGRLPFNPLNFHVLERLIDEGPARPSDLAAYLGVSRSTLSSALSALERRGLVIKDQDPDDGRAKQISLTDEGKATGEAIKRQNLLNAGVMLALVADEDRKSLSDLMGTVASGLSELLTSSPAEGD